MSPGASDGLHTVGRWIRDRGRSTPERVAIRCDGEATTYGTLDARSERLAAGLRARGLVPGDRVASLTANRPEHVELLLACAKAGLALVPCNWRLTVPELRDQLGDAEPALLLVDPEHAAKAAELGVPTATLDREGLDALADRTRDGVVPAAAAVHEPVADDAPLLIVYTSGTTGRPKGAVLTHANCFWTNLALDRTVPIGHDDVVLAVLPQFHVGGWNVQPLLALWAGATLVLERRFDAERALGLIASEGVTTMMGVPANYAAMADAAGFAAADLRTLRSAVVGGAAMPESLLATFAARGVAIVQGYGLTEAAPNVLCLAPEDAVTHAGWAGRPYPHVEVALRDPQGGGLLEGPGTGELVVRGPSVFPGYWRDPEATAATFAGGWLLTGDLAERDATGRYAIRGRRKEIYISGGENVAPAEVERVLAAHPAVAEAAVVGVPDARWGETGAAFVVPAAGATVDPAGLRAFAAERLATFKVPRTVAVVEALPRTALGKVQRAALRERAEGTA
ncbi:class I adenylate-forming enzyme family protein [Patulibacter americanus]|uniref:class I adenylate-forming enzyme family protein n=1 Tax=Patulibacter americanus TaxID=588672 RepID=UPI0003B65C9F|nr:AMP-binding protein [Patulibacter americanus]